MPEKYTAADLFHQVGSPTRVLRNNPVMCVLLAGQNSGLENKGGTIFSLYS
jgi:hypothetical protein